jgi:FkbM family methyltransferase
MKFIPGLFNHPLQITLSDGLKFFVRKFMTLYIFEEIFIHRCYDVELSGISNPIILDIGANTGLFLLRAKQRWPQSTIVCYEPFKPNFEELQKIVSENKFTKVKINLKGVGGEKRHAKLNIHKSNVGGHSILDLKQSVESVDIELDDLISALNQTPSGRCDLLKLDCEGAEYEIFYSMDDKIAELVPKIIFESEPGEQFETAKRHLETLRYKVFPFGELWLAIR